MAFTIYILNRTLYVTIKLLASHCLLLCAAVVNSVYSISSKWTVYFYLQLRLFISRLH